MILLNLGFSCIFWLWCGGRSSGTTGPSIILSYTPCISQGFPMAESIQHCQMAVDSGCLEWDMQRFWMVIGFLCFGAFKTALVGFFEYRHCWCESKWGKPQSATVFVNGWYGWHPEATGLCTATTPKRLRMIAGRLRATSSSSWPRSASCWGFNHLWAVLVCMLIILHIFRLYIIYMII